MIECLVCEKKGSYADIGKEWRLAPNRIGGYTCGKPCDDFIVAYDEVKKNEAKAAKKAAKSSPKTP